MSHIVPPDAGHHHSGVVEQVELLPSVNANPTLDVLKINANPSKEDTSPLLEDTRGASLSTSVDRNSDVASVHSMPAVLVTEPTSPVSQRPSTTPTADSFGSSARLQHSSPPPSQTVQEDTTSLQQRRARHRSAVEARASNRLSGFFTNLIHRREYPQSNSSRDIVREDPPLPPPLPSNSESASRASSPLPGRPVTPPPQLPAPTLQELGLSLSVLTSDLSPSHFSTPPTSGAFLAPHYLLLCHAQGLDVLPLFSPPASQPYALVRRVCFKSVVVMEQRGVLVAIAGRRDGVRVYALEEVKKAIEWRIDVEVRRERDRLRRETVKKSLMKTIDGPDSRDSADKTRKTSLSTPPPGDLDRPRANLRKASHGLLPPVPLIPRPATPRTPNKKPKTPPSHVPTATAPSGHPPPYINNSSDTLQTHNLHAQASAISLRARGGSLSNVLAAVPSSYRNAESRMHDLDSKVDWVESSDDEAIDIVAAGSSGSQALDERTSVSLTANRALSSPPVQPIVAQPSNSRRTSPPARRRNRPSNLDLSLAQSNATVSPPEPSPAPTLLTLRQALSHSPPSLDGVDDPLDPETPFAEGDDEDDEIDGRISLAQALLESRIPDLPPLGTTRPQQPILIAALRPLTAGDDEPSSARTSEGRRSVGQGNAENSSTGRRRRWSVLMSSPTQERSREPPTPTSVTPPLTAPAGERTRFTRSHSFRSNGSQSPSIQSVIDPTLTATSLASGIPSLPDTYQTFVPSSASRSRFIPRIISNAFNGRRSDDRSPVSIDSPIDPDSTRRANPGQFSPQSPPPKLEYVKLPGTKNALMVKAVETAKKSFLAILCGDNGEKVELFAGTYRTALGLSRTFILPDSPRSLELQLQGDDLVEVFLVFSQNVFGLEPATVRVREVRIGRAERRAARRRARENRTGEPSNNDADVQDEETNVNVSIGVSVAVGSSVVATGDGPDRPSTPALIANEHPSSQSDWPQTPDVAPSTSTSQPEELLAVATAQMGPYTTFQQLSFAPNFPLASIADDYIIPPTYPTFLEYRTEHEPDSDSTAVLSETQFSPPGLPIPTPTAPRWYYRDPKNIIHGPWKASLMQAWYKDGLLPPDLPVRREEDEEYTPLKDLRLQSVDPTQPFQSPIPVHATTLAPSAIGIAKPLLSPISLLSQPRHFGPPALFFSSRGGHSTAIVDARGRSVLKGRFIWSSDEDSKPAFTSKMGDIKRLEAFDVKDRSILVAMRQGGLEAVDLCDALLKPADESRTLLPQFNPPSSNNNRRAPFVWKIGTPIISSSTSMGALTNKAKGGLSHLASKKPSVGSGKSHAGKDLMLNDADLDPQDEVLFLGRKDDEIYFCERNAGSFRILRLSPHLL